MRTWSAVLLFAITLVGCPAPTPKPVPGGSATGIVVGSDFDDAPLTVGKGDLAGKPIVLTYFATW